MSVLCANIEFVLLTDFELSMVASAVAAQLWAPPKKNFQGPQYLAFDMNCFRFFRDNNSVSHHNANTVVKLKHITRYHCVKIKGVILRQVCYTQFIFH